MHGGRGGTGMRNPIYHEKLQDIEIRPVELPEVEGPIPDTDSSHPFNAANRQQVPLNLAYYGYVEEEYIVSGYSNVYEYHDVGLYPKIRCENGRYCTRILIRRPVNPEKQSGFALLEVFNYGSPCERAFASWGNCSQYILSRGDVWVGITIKQNAINNLKRYDPQRYEKLGFPNPIPAEKRRRGNTMVGAFEHGTPEDFENGLAYDAISQVAALLKAKVPQNPLCRDRRFGKPARYVLAVGASGCDLSLSAAALQPFATTDGARPCIDGFHIHMTGYPGFISNGETRFDADDDRCKIMTNVPLIWTQTMGDMRGGGIHPSYSYMYRWPDSDLPGRQHRQYEIAGAPLGSIRDHWCFPCAEDISKATGTEYKPKDPLKKDDDMPFDFVLRAALDHLKRWVKDGVPAPKSKYIEMQGEYPDADFVLDEHGNPKGGVRSPYLDVPTKTYTWCDDPCTGGNIVTPFPPEKLKALYPTHDDYVRKVIISTLSMIKDGFLLPEDASKIIFEAMDAPIPE